MCSFDNWARSEMTRRKHWISFLKTSRRMFLNKISSSRIRTFWWRMLRAPWPTCVIFIRFWKLRIQWFVKFRARLNKILEVPTMKEEEVASMKMVQMREIMLVWLVEVTNQSISSTLLVLLNNLILKDLEDSFSDQRKVNHTCIFNNTMTFPTLDKDQDQSTSLSTKMDQCSLKKLKESAIHSQVRDLAFQTLTLFLHKSHKWQIKLLVPSRPMKWPRSHSKSSWSNSIRFKLRLQIVEMVVKVNHQLFTFTKCS